jgi:transcription elongation factor Elf1
VDGECPHLDFSSIFVEEKTMKITDRVTCPGCNMFTWAHEMEGKNANGAHVCSACATRHIAPSQGITNPTAVLRLVYSEVDSSPPAQVATKRQVA